MVACALANWLAGLARAEGVDLRVLMDARRREHGLV
jgi:hypothetical protein